MVSDALGAIMLSKKAKFIFSYVNIHGPLFSFGGI